MGIYCSSAANNPLVTERKLNVHMTFRRRLGHILNVLYTSNFCPLPSGKGFQLAGNCKEEFKASELRIKHKRALTKRKSLIELRKEAVAKDIKNRDLLIAYIAIT